MTHQRVFFILFLAVAAARPSLGAAPAPDAPRRASPSLPALLNQAAARLDAQPRVDLVPESAILAQELETLEPAGSGRVPNYLRAMVATPGAVKPMAHLVRTVFMNGRVDPTLKVAMGLQVALSDNSPYVAAHLNRLLQASDHGKRLARAVAGQPGSNLSPAEAGALAYAAALGRGPTELTDEEFRKARVWYNDAQVVELTVVVCFTSYFTRFCEGLNLPVERWVLETPGPTLPLLDASPERVALLTDEEVSLFRESVERAAAPRSATDPPAAATTAGGAAGRGPTTGIANSQRAMGRAPEHRRAWFNYMSTAREGQLVDRTLKLHVSFAVSMANGCRYCTLHQVRGLRRQGVDPAKLIAMRKDDAALAPRELAAVRFARKLTQAPASVTDADYQALAAEFTPAGALEVLLQTCTFNFMNRFTDGLRLPSEDDAIRTYQEVYGPGSYESYGKSADGQAAR
jgi:uncharacterized peroxidase-related enzyme